MNRGHVAVATGMIVVGVAGLVIGVVAFASGDLAMVGLVVFGALLVVLGTALLRAAVRAARPSGPAGRRGRPDTDGAGYHPYPAPSGDTGSGWHVDRQRDGGHDNSSGSEAVGGGDSGAAGPAGAGPVRLRWAGPVATPVGAGPVATPVGVGRAVATRAAVAAAPDVTLRQNATYAQRCDHRPDRVPADRPGHHRGGPAVRLRRG